MNDKELTVPLVVRHSPLLPLCLVLLGAALALAVAARRVEPLLLALAPLYGLTSAAGGGAAPVVTVEAGLVPRRVPEGGTGEFTLRLRARGLPGAVAASLGLELPPGVSIRGEAAGGAANRGAPDRGGVVRRFVLANGRPVNLSFTVVAERRGSHRLGRATLRAILPGTLRLWEATLPIGEPWEALPARVAAGPRAGLPVRPKVVGVQPGQYLSRRVGSGVEFAGLREYGAGDVLGDLDWRASARWQKWVIRQRLAARNAEVVILLDALSTQGSGRANTFDACVRVAANLAFSLLAEGNRVGLITYGGVLSWVRPGAGRAHRWRLLRELRDAAVTPTFAHKDIRTVPRRILPPRAVVVGVTSLTDNRFTGVLGNLKARGWPVSAVYVPPGSVVTPGDETGRLALRLQALEHRILLDRLREVGVAVAGAPATAVTAPGGEAAGTAEGSDGRPTERPAPVGAVFGRGGVALSALAVLASLGAGLGSAVLGPPGGAVGLGLAVASAAVLGAFLLLAAVALGPGLAGGVFTRTPLVARLAVSMAAIGAAGVVAVGLAAGLAAGLASSLSARVGSWLALVAGAAGLVLGVALILRVASGKAGG